MSDLCLTCSFMCFECQQVFLFLCTVPQISVQEIKTEKGSTWQEVETSRMHHWSSIRRISSYREKICLTSLLQTAILDVVPRSLQYITNKIIHHKSSYLYNPWKKTKRSRKSVVCVPFILFLYWQNISKYQIHTSHIPTIPVTMASKAAFASPVDASRIFLQRSTASKDIRKHRAWACWFIQCQKHVNELLGETC